MNRAPETRAPMTRAPAAGPPPPASCDVLVIGAGPAGAATALLLAARGHDVLLVDRHHHPRWKVCGCCLAGEGVRLLGALGLGDLLDRVDAARPERVEIVGTSRRVHLPLHGTRVVSRARLDTALAEAATSAGAQFHPGWSAALESPGMTTGPRVVRLRRGAQTAVVSARIVVAATGLTPLPGTADAQLPPSPQLAAAPRIGTGAVFAPGSLGAVEPTPSEVRMLVGRSGYLGLARLEDGRVDAAAAIDPEAMRHAGGLAASIADLLGEVGASAPDSDPVEGWRGTPVLTRSHPVPGADRLLLVGDAAGYVEPFTGEGMTWALQAAFDVVPVVDSVLSDGWRAAHLDRWRRRCNRAGRRRSVIRAVAWTTRSPRRVSAALQLLSVAPWIAAPWVRRVTAPEYTPAALGRGILPSFSSSETAA